MERGNKMPHLIGCTIGIESMSEAENYAKQLGKMKDGNKRLYEWVKPSSLSDTINNTTIKTHPVDAYNINKYCTENGNT